MTNSPSFEALFNEIERTAKLVRELTDERRGFIVNQDFCKGDS